MNERFTRAGALARVELGHEPDFAIGAIEVRPSRREIAGERWQETVEPRVMRVLVALARARGEILTRDDLIETCWDGVIVGEDAINRCIGRLRKVAEASGNAFSIETVPRVGYRLIAPDAMASAPEAIVSAASEPVTRRLRIFLSSPGDVTTAREIAAQTIERLAQDYARFFTIAPYLSEYEAWIASGDYQDVIESPSAFDIVVLILWSRLGSPLPERTRAREYRGIDGRTPVTGTEWEYEEALKAARGSGKPDILLYRCRRDAHIKSMDSDGRRKDFEQLEAVDRFWSHRYDNKNTYLGAYTDFGGDAELAAILETDLRKLIEKRIGKKAGSEGERRAKVWMQAPFRGLESYEFEHAPIFFGQDEALTKAMVQLVANAEAGSPFLLVLGASGSGKSSLVKAGIVPKLFVPRRVRGAAFLHRVVFRPSDAQEDEDLFDALARRLTTQIDSSDDVSALIGPGQSIATLATHLRNAGKESGYPIARSEGRIQQVKTGKLVLVVDQLEELFTNERLTSRDQQNFIALLSGLVHSGLVWVVATMRKDFWHRADDTPQLVHMAEGNGRLELLPPTKLQLSQMIRRPAAAAGVGFEHHHSTDVPLNDAIAEEVARAPGALPLLSFLLDQLYRSDVVEAGSNVLTYATYERLGRLEGAIATRAEAVLERCAPEDRPELGSVLFALVQMDTTDQDVERAVSRRVPLAAFPPGTAQRRLVETLLYPGARLLVSDADAGGHPTVRVAHEALITRWERARDFVQRNADALKIRRRIEERYALWRSLKEDAARTTNANFLRQRLAAWRARAGHEAGLLSEIDLIDGQRLLREHRADTDSHLVNYIERSDADDKRLRRRSFRVLAIVASIVTLLAIVASAAGLLALQKQHAAEAQTQQTLAAQSRALTNAAATLLKQGNVPLAQAIIFEVLASRHPGETWPPEANNLFLEARVFDRQIAVLCGFNAAAYSPDGRRVVTVCPPHTARIWDAESGKQLTVFSGHSAGLAGANFSPDGRRVVTASADKTARIWDAETGKQLLVLSGHNDVVYSAVYSPDGRRILTASRDKTARIWDAESGRQLWLSGYNSILVSAAFSPDGRRVVTAHFDRTARIWDAANGKQLAALSGHDNVLRSAAFSPDGRSVVTASDDKTARIWDAESGKQLVTLSGHGDAVNYAAFSPDGRRIVTASDDKTARIWDAITGSQLAILSEQGAAVISAAWSPDGRRIVTASLDRTARIWEAASDREIAVLSGHAAYVDSAAYSPDGRRIVTTSGDKTARVWDAASGKQLMLLSGHNDMVWSAAYSPDGLRIVTASYDKTARTWDARSGKQLAVLSGHADTVRSSAYSPDGRRIVTGSFDKTARIWDAATGKQLAVLSGHGSLVTSAAFSPDGRRIVTASDDKTARVWDAASGKQLVVLSGHENTVESAAFSPDGRRIITASADRTARIWDTASGKQLAVLSGHGNWVESAAYSPDGRRIVTASRDETARIWDAASGRQLAILSGHGDAVLTAVFSPDGRRIVTASFDKTARIWDAKIPAIRDEQLIAWSQAAQTVALSSADRLQFGLPTDARVRTWPDDTSKCNSAATSPDDPDRKTQGVVQAAVTGDSAALACTQEIARSGSSPRLSYQLGRAFLAKHDVKGARRAFEIAVSSGYRAAQIDLANLLVNVSAGTPDAARATALDEKAWNDGVPIAAFELGELYEHGIRGAAANTALRSDPSKAWSWYRKGADMGEPNALARFGERDDAKAVAESASAKKHALMLSAFRYYAAAAERAQDEDWPDDAWSNWRYRRATLARLLAREGMIPQVAVAYTQVRDKWRQHPPTLLQRILAWLHV